MYFQYGTYRHADHEVTLQISQRPAFSQRGYRELVRHTWTLSGEVLAEGQAAIKAALANLAAAYADDGQNAGLYHDDGVVSAHSLDSSAAVGGVRVTSLDFPEGDAAEYVSSRKYTITLEADFLDTSQQLAEFRETIRRVGTGGPRFIVLETLTGPPVRQIVNRRTIQTITQSGSAIGLAKYPTPPAPLYAAHEHLDRREIVEGPPEAKRGTSLHYPISWSYTFEF